MKQSQRPLRLRQIRLSVVILVTTLSAIGLVVSVGVAPAQACSVGSGDHCYAEAVQGTSTNYGFYGIINAACLHISNDGNFANNEIWDATSNNEYWEEVGLKVGTAYSGTYYSNKTWFWADSRPGGSYHEHVPSIAAAGTNIGYSAEIVFEGSQEWNIYGGNSIQLIGTSTSQSAALNSNRAGTEYTSGGADMDDKGIISSLQSESTGNVWQSWGSASQENFGPSYYISGSYSGAKETWDWAC